MKITQKQKDELKSIAQTFLAVFIPLAAVTLQATDFSNLTKETVIALSTALLRSAIKVLWQIIATRLTK